ncbi:uncharacterized protein GLRG_07695 [Colletotrichum graminicola M1.001]|uniref:Uncharacterized protein n=1 Tax=Colletotrichum graminicola (strain M1.001 / M2 / FGSC 10212) TaxID=645133 RepID=E3QNR8_COLGM|nr:uncharacterized protein GLRG_07695 [Colletotrichum graminicola M1.001]EFQ32425.1 hypothetical protein GLRG_07695 [Colletotrichum graminicola M1.001]
MNRMQLLEEQAQDSLALEAEFDSKVKEVLDQHYSNLQSLRKGAGSNGNILKFKRSTKKLQRRIKYLQNQRLRNKTWLNRCYETRANQYMEVLRGEWITRDYCYNYPFWGDEMSSSETQTGHGTRGTGVACHHVVDEEEHGVITTGC